MNLTPHARALHWSAAYLPARWIPGASGPDAYDCWHLVREVQRAHFGRDLPALDVSSPDHAVMHEIVRRSAWRRHEGAVQEGDILLMLNARGELHIGVAVETPALHLLHASGCMEDGQPTGGVTVDPIDGLGRLGFGHLEAWRWQP